MKIINTEQLRARLATETAAVFDVRGDVIYEQGHIPGAKTAPMGSLTFRVARIMNADSFVAVYSAGGSCGLAAQAAERLENLGLLDVHLYEDGLKGWEAAGLEVIPSASPKIHTQGPVKDVRPLIVDRESSYGGAFKGKPTEGGAGG